MIKEETGGDFTTALLAMLNTKRDQNTVVDMELAKKDAKVEIKLRNASLSHSTLVIL